MEPNEELMRLMDDVARLSDALDTALGTNGRLQDKVKDLEVSVLTQATRVQQLEGRLEDSTDRAARSRDSIVSLRERLKTVRAERHTLQQTLEEENAAAKTEATYVEGFTTGSAAASRSLFNALLEQVSEYAFKFAEVNSRLQDIERSMAPQTVKADS